MCEFFFLSAECEFSVKLQKSIQESVAQLKKIVSLNEVDLLAVEIDSIPVDFSVVVDIRNQLDINS